MKSEHTATGGPAKAAVNGAPSVHGAPSVQAASSVHAAPSVRAAPLAQALSLEELHAAPAAGRAAQPPVLESANPLHGVKLSLQACVGQARLTVGELLQAREGQVLSLDCGVEQAIDLMLEGKVVARGQLVAVDGCFAVRISELPLPLKV